jgi:hypothetical protein
MCHVGSTFYRNYPPLQQTWSDLVLCGLLRPKQFQFLHFYYEQVFNRKSVILYFHPLHPIDTAVLQENFPMAENVLFLAHFKHLRVTVTSFSMFYSYMKQMKSKTDLVHSK